MISKILKLENIGLLQNATLNGAVTLGRVTAFYADNGRGKSTLASVFRACQLGDARRLIAKTTIDATSAPEVKFLLENNKIVEFTAGAWKTTAANILVFDSEFVEQNVYSGFEVRAEQRQALLEFALGTQTVKLKQRIDQLTQEIDAQTRKRTQAEKTLAGFARPYLVPDFIALDLVPDAQQRISELQKRIEAAKNARQLGARKDPIEIPEIEFDFPNTKKLLQTRLKDVQNMAEAAVRAHLSKHNVEDFEDWVSRGQAYLGGTECPFCGQLLGNLDLIESYGVYFSNAYADLKQQLNDLESVIFLQLSDATVSAASSNSSTNAARIEAWKDQLDLRPPSLDHSLLATTIQRAREQLLSLVTTKLKSPLESVGSDAAFTAAIEAVDAVNGEIRNYNAAIRTQAEVISSFVKGLVAENPSLLAVEIERLMAAQRKELFEVKSAIADHQSAEIERRRLDTEKTATRQQLDSLMEGTLQQYQTSINDLLAVFGAEFSIEKLKPTYVGGGEPRSEYGLKLRAKSVKLGSRDEIATSRGFGNTLSEGDKRTLAFAFFVARLKADASLSDKIVVFDDPVSSLDRNRRYQSTRQVGDMAIQCKQLIVMSHDAYFLRELRDLLESRSLPSIKFHPLCISRVAGGYSAFANCDLDKLCESDYYQHHRMVTDFVQGRSTVTNREVAKAIRPLMEGYYHRRFPGILPKKAMFGKVIDDVATAQPSDPLHHLQKILPELREVNEYAKQFHHDGGDSLNISDSELLQYASKALDLIYRNG